MSDVLVRRGRVYMAHADKRRPVLVVSPDYRNDLASNVLVVPLTTRIRPAPTHVVLRAGEGGVPSASSLQCEQITTVWRGHVEPIALGSALSPARIREVERAMQRALGISVEEPEP